MISFAITLLTHTFVHAASPPEALFVSLSANRALVLAGQNGQLGVLSCRLPEALVPDVTFSKPGALDHCRASAITIQDTPEHRALFARQLESVFRERIARGLTLEQRLNRLLYTAASVVPLTAVIFVTPKILKLLGRVVEPFGTFGEILQASSAFTLTSLMFVNFADDHALRYQRLMREAASASQSAEGPALLKTDLASFNIIKRCVNEALRRSSGRVEQNRM